MHNITFVNKANFLKVYNNFVLKWLIIALYVVVVHEQTLLGRIWRTILGFVTSVQRVYKSYIPPDQDEHFLPIFTYNIV
jgi:hypothetical protein